MWRQCKIAARWGAFLGMLAAFLQLLFFFSYPRVTYPNGSGWVSVHGSFETIRAVQRDFDDQHHGVGHALEGLDYVRWHVNQYSPSTVTLRIPYGVFIIPLALICIGATIPVVIIALFQFFVALCWLLPPKADNLKPLQLKTHGWHN